MRLHQRDLSSHNESSYDEVSPRTRSWWCAGPRSAAVACAAPTAEHHTLRMLLRSRGAPLRACRHLTPTSTQQASHVGPRHLGEWPVVSERPGQRSGQLQ